MKLGRIALTMVAVAFLIVESSGWYSACSQGAGGFSGRVDTPQAPLGGTPPVLVPSDVTNPPMGGIKDPGSRAARGLYGQTTVPGTMPAPAGIRQIPHGKFVELVPHSSESGIYIAAAKGAVLDRSNPSDVELTSGQMVLSVVHPSKMALVTTTLGEVSVQAEGAALISYADGVLRVVSLLGQNNHVQIALHKGPLSGANAGAYVVDSSNELAAGLHKLTVSDLHPPDGIGRRGARLLSQGYLAVSQVSLNSALYANDVLSQMWKQPAAPREKQIVQSISKMAAVLNYVNGAGGYVTQAKPP